MELIANTSDLESADRLSVFVDDIPALLVRSQGEYLVIEDVCSHDGQPLTDGKIDDCSIACPRHGARFDLKTGAPLCMPATRPIRTFRVEVRDSEIWAEPN
jgi:3-phenylpropionate/trans-cinnamate dioxygenase ferredoxin subunit